MKRYTALLIPLLVGMSMSIASAASGGLVRQETVGPYRFVLMIGQAEAMSMSRHASHGEVMLSGKMAGCQMAMAGMSMGGATCNHHLEVHIYKGKQVVKGARVRITVESLATRHVSPVPVMTMMDARIGMRDYHYGNNVYLPRGRYLITVWVGAVRAAYTVSLP